MIMLCTLLYGSTARAWTLTKTDTALDSSNLPLAASSFFTFTQACHFPHFDQPGRSSTASLVPIPRHIVCEQGPRRDTNAAPPRDAGPFHRAYEH